MYGMYRLTYSRHLVFYVFSISLLLFKRVLCCSLSLWWVFLLSLFPLFCKVTQYLKKRHCKFLFYNNLPIEINKCILLYCLFPSCFLFLSFKHRTHKTQDFYPKEKDDCVCYVLKKYDIASCSSITTCLLKLTNVSYSVYFQVIFYFSFQAQDSQYTRLITMKKGK